MRQLLAALFVFSSFALSAQLTKPVQTQTRTPVGVSLSEITKFRNIENIYYEILPYGDDFFVYSTTLGGSNPIIRQSTFRDLYSLTLYRYNSALKRTGELQVSWPDERRDHLSLSSLGDALLWTYATEGRAKDEFQISCEVLDGEGNLISNHKMLTVNRQDYFYLSNFTEYSADQHYFATVFADRSPQRLLSKRDDENATITIAVFDNLGELVTLKKKRLTYNRDQLEIQAVAVDNEGQAYVLAKIYTNSKGRETRGGSDSKVFIYTLAPGADELETTELKLAGQYIEGVSLVPGRNGKPAVAGVYSERLGQRIVGYFATDDPQSGDVLKPKPFSQRTLEEMGRRITARRGGELVMEGSFEFRDAIRLSNGQLSILLESFDIRITNNNVGFGGTVGMAGGQQTTYIYGEGVILSFNDNSDLEQVTVIPKFQTTEVAGSPFMRMNLVEYDGRPAVIYNDNPKNFGRDLDKRTRPLALARALAMVSYSTSDGRLQRKPIFSRNDADKLILVPSSARRLANDDVVFMAMRYKALGKNELRFGLISE